MLLLVRTDCVASTASEPVENSVKELESGPRLVYVRWVSIEDGTPLGQGRDRHFGLPRTEFGPHFDEKRVHSKLEHIENHRKYIRCPRQP